MAFGKSTPSLQLNWHWQGSAPSSDWWETGEIGCIKKIEKCDACVADTFLSCSSLGAEEGCPHVLTPAELAAGDASLLTL